MKALIFILITCFCTYMVNAQICAMQTISIAQCQLTAKIPAYHTTFVDTLGLKMYSSLTEDSLIGAQLFVYDNYSLDSNYVLADYMLEYNETDTLKTIAKFMVAAAQGTLIFFQVNENYPTSKSMDVGMKYSAQNTSFISFTRMILKDKRMVILNVFSQECYMQQLLLTTNACNNGLACY